MILLKIKVIHYGNTQKFKSKKNKSSFFAKEGDEIIDVPVVLDNATFVNAILSTKLSSEVLYKLFKGDEYGSYGFDKDPDREVPNADDIVGKIMDFEKDIWGTEFFKVNDNRLFDYWPLGTTKPQSFFVSVATRFVTVEITYVCDFTTGGELTGCPPGVDHCYELVPVYCENHWTVWVEDDEGVGGWTTTPPPGGAGGGGSNPSAPAACNNGMAWVRLAQNGETGTWEDPCTNFPVIPEFFNPANLHYGIGTKPLKEYSSDNRCAGLKDMWENYPLNEVVGFVTEDDKLIVTHVVNIDGGAFRGLYRYQNPVTNSDQYYYVYPISEGAPALNYPGILERGNNYFIPVKASVHTHTPCRTDGTNGVSQDLSPEDADLAEKFPELKNWAIGCNAIARFDNTSNEFFDKYYGDISTTCVHIP